MKKAIWGVALALLALGVCAFAWVQWLLLQQNRALEQSLAHIREAGEPMTLAELNTWYPSVPDIDNAAPAYLRAFEVMSNPSDEQAKQLPLVGNGEMPPAHEPLPDAMRQALDVFLSQNEEAILLLHDAGAMEACRYPIDYTTAPDAASASLDYLSSASCAARLLALDAISQAHQGHAAIAASGLCDLFALGHSLEMEPSLLAQLNRLNIYRIGCQAAERVLNAVPLEEADLARLEKTLGLIVFQDGLYRAYVGERCFIMSHASVTNGRAPLFAQANLVEFQTGMSALIDATELPIYEGLEQVRREWDEVRTRKPRFLHYLLTSTFPSFIRSYSDFAYVAALVDCAQAATAVERYRIAFGTVPLALDALPPEYQEAVSADPFDGAPLRYRRHQGGYSIYSVGGNGIDDAGTPPQDAENILQSGDITFTVNH